MTNLVVSSMKQLSFDDVIFGGFTKKDNFWTYALVSVVVNDCIAFGMINQYVITFKVIVQMTN